MSGGYSPNSANSPTSYTIPNDGDLANAASVNVALTALMDKAAHLDLFLKVQTQVLNIAGSSSIVTTTSATFVDITGTTLSFTKGNAIGDYLVVLASVNVQSAAAQVIGNLRGVVSDGGTFNVNLQTQSVQTSLTANTNLGFTYFVAYPFASANATPAVKLQVADTGGSHVSVFQPLSMTGFVLRAV